MQMFIESIRSRVKMLEPAQTNNLFLAVAANMIGLITSRDDPGKILCLSCSV